MKNTDDLEFSVIENLFAMSEEMGLKYIDETFAEFLKLFKDNRDKLRHFHDVLNKRLIKWKSCGNGEYQTMYEGLVRTADSCL